MGMPVELSTVAEALDYVTSGCEAFIDRKRGEVAWFTDEEMALAEAEQDPDMPDWMAEVAADVRRVTASDDFIPLPDKFEIHEYGIMDRYCMSVADSRLSERLSDAIRGRGAFGRFRDMVAREGLRDDWSEFRHRALMCIGEDFLRDKGIPFVGVEAVGDSGDGDRAAGSPGMFHMLSCFDIAPGVDIGDFQAEYMEFVEDMRRLGLVEGTGPLGRRQSDTPMDTDDERTHQYFILMNFRDRAQVDAAYAHMTGHEGPGVEVHKSVYSKIRNPAFICWADVEGQG